MPATNDRPRLAPAIVATVALAAVVVLMAIDLGSELIAGSTPFHLAIEMLATAFGAAGVIALVRHLRELVQEAQDLRADLASSREEAARWAREARTLIDGLSDAIDAQLDRWKLTPAEKGVTLLLLKGLGHKEIATVREVGETTVRQQARSVYRKAGLAGRHELAAFFLEDLLGPQPAAR